MISLEEPMEEPPQRVYSHLFLKRVVVIVNILGNIRVCQLLMAISLEKFNLNFSR